MTNDVRRVDTRVNQVKRKEHVGKILHNKAAADSGKRSSGKGTGTSVDPEATRCTQHAKVKAETQ